jgi:hypothetical protein
MRTCSCELSTTRRTTHCRFRGRSLIDRNVRSIKFFEPSRPMIDARQIETKINQTSRSQNPRAQRCVPLKVRIETIAPQFGDRVTMVSCHRHNPYLTKGLSVLVQAGFGRDVVLEIRKSITEDGSSALVAGISRRPCSSGLPSGARRHWVRTFPSTSTAEAALVLNQRINDDWVFPVEE